MVNTLLREIVDWHLVPSAGMIRRIGCMAHGGTAARRHGGTAARRHGASNEEIDHERGPGP
jgi:hypothetical protein